MVNINQNKAIELTEVILWINSRGWSPATSTNYSFKNSDNPLKIAISQSGIDKSKFTCNHLMLVDEHGMPTQEFEHLKSSAETLLHTVLYQENNSIEFILHTHSVYGTILSEHFLNDKQIILSGYEVLKGLGNNKTHDISVAVPIFENTQDIYELSENFRTFYRENNSIPGYLISGHGLYTWGKNLEEAKRQLEVLEFLLECEYRKMCICNR